MYDNPLHLVRITTTTSNEIIQHQRIIVRIKKIYYRPIGIYIGLFFAGLGIVECIYYFTDNSFKLWEMVFYLYISILGAVSVSAWCVYYICCKKVEQLENTEEIVESV